MFTILANRRSGSHLLGTLLDSHPELSVYDEILNENALTVLPVKFFDELSENEGFILLYYQFLHTITEETREVVLKSPVIHLHRNVEDQTRSYYAMRNTDLPVHTTEQVEYPEIGDEYKSLKPTVYALNKAMKKYDINALDLDYEWLTGNRHISELPLEKARVLCEYLGVTPMPLTTNLYKLCS